MNKCALDCSPPLNYLGTIFNGSAPKPRRISVHEIAAYHAGRKEPADFIFMFATCCYSSHPDCEAMNAILRSDHAKLLQAGRRVAPLFDYRQVTTHPLATTRMLLGWAPYLGSLDPETPRLEEAARLTGKVLEDPSVNPLTGKITGKSGRHEGLIAYLASKNFTLAPKQKRNLRRMSWGWGPMYDYHA